MFNIFPVVLKPNEINWNQYLEQNKNIKVEHQDHAQEKQWKTISDYRCGEKIENRVDD